MKIKQQAGFTLIELLVVIAIVGLLASVILVGMGNARLKGRDAKRLSDIGQIKSGLEIYYSHGAGYPDTTAWDTSQSSLSNLSCSGQVAFKVPQDVLNASDPSFDYDFTHGGNQGSGCGGNVHSNYKVEFKTEGATSLGPAGTYWLSPAGISSTEPF